jgi:hypothetical protein
MYALVHRCDGLEAGVFYFDRIRHLLLRIPLDGRLTGSGRITPTGQRHLLQSRTTGGKDRDSRTLVSMESGAVHLETPRVCWRLLSPQRSNGLGMVGSAPSKLRTKAAASSVAVFVFVGFYLAFAPYSNCLQGNSGGLDPGEEEVWMECRTRMGTFVRVPLTDDHNSGPAPSSGGVVVKAFAAAALGGSAAYLMLRWRQFGLDGLVEPYDGFY